LTPDDNLVTITFPAAISSTSQAGNDPVYRSTRLTQPINLIDTGQAGAGSASGNFVLLATYAIGFPLIESLKFIHNNMSSKFVPINSCVI
jgi:hypothetical protein